MKKILLLLIFNFCFAQVSVQFYNQIKQNEVLLSQNKISKVINNLNEMLKKYKKNDEKLYIYQLLINSYIKQNILDKAIYFSKEALKLKLDKTQKNQIQENLLALFLQNKNYENYIKNAQNFNKDLNKNLAISYFFLKEYKNAIKYATLQYKKDNFDLQNINILYASFMKENDYENAIKYFLKLKDEYKNKEEYFINLAFLYEQINFLKQRISTLEFAYQKGFIKKQKYILYYAKSLHDYGLYEKAANIMIKERVNNLDFIINCLIKAKDYQRAINFSKKYANDNESFVKLAKLLYKNQNYKESLNVTQKIKYLKNSFFEGEVLMLKAINYYGLNDEKKAQKYLQLAYENSHSKNKVKAFIQAK